MGMMKEDDNGSKGTILKTVMSNKVLKGQSSTLIDKADLKNLTKQEHYCIHVLKRETSLGKNIEDGLQVLIILPCFTDYLYELSAIKQGLFVVCIAVIIWLFFLCYMVLPGIIYLKFIPFFFSSPVWYIDIILHWSIKCLRF